MRIFVSKSPGQRYKVGVGRKKLKGVKNRVGARDDSKYFQHIEKIVICLSRRLLLKTTLVKYKPLVST